MTQKQVRIIMVGMGIIALILISSVLSGAVFRANLGDVGLDSEGYVHLDNVHMEKNENYTIYLVYLPGFAFPPSVRSSTVRDEGELVEIYDENSKRIPNRIRWLTEYGTLSESGCKISVFTAQGQGLQPLVLRFSERNPRDPAFLISRGLEAYDIVIRESSLSAAWLIIVSDRSNVLVVIAIVVVMLFSTRQKKGQQETIDTREH